MNPSLYIHIPVCKKKCDYCDFFSVHIDRIRASNREESDLNDLIQCIIQEINIRKAEHSVSHWKTVYIGGGTPSLLAPKEIHRLCLGILDNSFDPSTDFEFTIEANPEDISVEWLEACMNSGINRLSLGIQSMSDILLTKIGRRGTRKGNLEALSIIKSKWKGKLSIDLISGLPGQTWEMQRNDIYEIISNNPDHVSLYSLTIDDNTPLGKKEKRSLLPDLPTEDEAANMWISGRDLLERSGYSQYEVSNFAKPGYESKHNLTYWNLGSFIGIGPGATGAINDGETAYRYTNGTDIQLWLKNPGNTFIGETIIKKDCIKEVILMGMRLRKGILRKSFKERFGKDIIEFIGKTLRSWQDEGKLIITQDAIALSQDGLLLLNLFLKDCMEELC